MTEPRLAPYQFTRDEAIAFAQAGTWQKLSPQERGLLQLRQDLMCMDFSVFHEGITELLGRPVYTHEFAKPDMLWEEYLGVREKPDLEAIIAKLPEHLRKNMIVIERGDG